tara:strand:+ start:570 stop:860 length:291 start_codon:yes stop_codon:yes gene_type:complete
MKENKLIAEFMGLCPLSRSGFISDKKQEYYGSLSDLQYHTSWDWLMPVVQKISDDYYNTPFDETLSNLTEVYENIWTLQDLHGAVVEFINQLNKES